MLLGMSFPPFPFPLLAGVAFVPLLLVWNEALDARSAYLSACVAYLATFAVAFQWPLFHTFGTTALLSLPPLLILPMWMAVPFGLSHVVARRLGLWAGLTALATFHVLMEAGLRFGPLAFPWTLIGHTQATTPFVNRLAALGGVPLLTLTVLAVNGCIVAGMRGRLRSRAAMFIAVGLPVIAAGIYGCRTAPGSSDESAAEVHAPHALFKVAGIQPSYSPESWADLSDGSRVSMLLRLSNELLSDTTHPPDLIVWPETAIPPGPNPITTFRRLQAFSDSSGVPLLAGAVTSGSVKGAYRNSALLFTPGETVRRYDKVNLVPFAERVPFASAVPLVDRLAVPAGGVRGYEPGKTGGMFEISGRSLGVLICFETLFDGQARELAREDARGIVAITQDGWWGNSFGYRQHLAFNRLRPMETGLPMLQVSVSGKSALILPDGRVHELGGWMERVSWRVDMPLPSAPPPYVRYGDWVTLSALFAALVMAVMYYSRRGASASEGGNEDNNEFSVSTSATSA